MEVKAHMDVCLTLISGWLIEIVSTRRNVTEKPDSVGSREQRMD
jgi:hypothetical protein